MPKNKLFLVMLFVISSCGQEQNKPVVYDAVTIDNVCEKDDKGKLLHENVQVEGFLTMPGEINNIWGGSIKVTLHEAPNTGQSIETSIWVDTAGKNRIILKSIYYTEETLKMADKDGNPIKFSDKVLLQGTLFSQTSGKSPGCYIDVTNIQKSPTPDDIPLYRPVNKQMNETFSFAGVSYVVRAARFAKTAGNESYSVTAHGIFLILEMEIKNTSDAAVYPGEDVKLKDDKGMEFAESDDGGGALTTADQFGDIFVGIEPHQSKTRVLIFDVPDKKTCYLHIAQNSGRSKSAVVTIPGN